MERNLPNNWAIAHLHELSEVVAGNPAPQGKEFFEGGTFPFVRVHDMGKNNCRVFLRKTRDLVNEKAAKKLKVFPAGSVLFTKSGASTLLNQRAILAGDSFVVSHIAASVPFVGVSSKWLYYWLTMIDFAALAHATNMPSLPLSRAKNIEVPLAPAAEQERLISKLEELFSELNKGIESLKTAQDKLKVYRQAVLKHAFEGKLTAEWREENKDKLETADQLVARVKKEREARYEQQLEEWGAAVKTWDAKGKQGKKPSRSRRPKPLDVISTDEKKLIAELPVGWAYARLGEVIDEPKYGTSKKCDYDIGGIGVLRIPNVAHGSIDAIDLKYAQCDDDEIEAYALKRGDILTIRSNGSISLVGKCALISEAEACYLYAGYLIRLRPNEQLILPEFLISVLSGHFLRMQFEAKAKSTSGVNNINSGEIQNLIVPVCGTAEQQELVRQLATTLSSIDATEAEIDGQMMRAESLRQSILKRAFSGLLVDQDPNDEPASVLLERIKAEKTSQVKNNKKNKTKDVA